MLLYANGDSHTAPWSYIDVIGESFGISIINDAIGGSSNTSIIRRTKNFLQNTIPDLIIIGWSTWEREEWHHDGKYYNVNSSGHDVLPKKLQLKYKNWVQKQTQKSLNKKSRYWHTKIFEFHQEIEHIPHVFFNCMYDFFNTRYQYPWGHCYIGPYENNLSYYHWLTAKGCKTDNWYHFKEDGHRLWANHIQKYIKENKIL